jgi:Mg2+/Co2+ transporter CorB
MAFDLPVALLAIFVLQLLAAYFSAAETSLTAVSPARMQKLAGDGSRAAAAVNALIADRERLIGAVLLGRNFVNILAASIAAFEGLQYWGTPGIFAAAFLMTVVILVFSHVLPKTLAAVQADAVALALAPPMRFFVALLGPLVAIVQGVVRRSLKLFGFKAAAEMPVLSAHEELRGAIDMHHQEGAVEREQRDMLGGILDLGELAVADVMVHRRNMTVIDADAPLAETVELVLSAGHTRYPIWKDDPENIVGVLHIKDLLRDLSQRRGSLDGVELMALAKPPWFVPDTTGLDEQVHAFRQRRGHFALVVDEYGTLQGLVTLEDILEEVFGDIAEAHDAFEPMGFRPQSDGSYLIEGTTPVRALNRELGWGLPDDAATTIAGLVIHDARIIPDVGQVFSFHGFKFEVLKRQRNQVTALRIFAPKRTVRARPRAAEQDLEHAQA